ncbi:MAG: hypothetical protein AUJ98_06765 [Bacteroidetes bacterium CG2_30_33_31]|nr:MAG: hypothetical protein AUJ98_06765 [Bacteroidetes bacterium CG2_30_33_31]
MKRFASIIFFLIFCLALSAQTDSIYLKGKYFESNLYVFNPSVGDNFSVCMYVINGDSIYNELKSNAIEIDFQLLGIQIEADVEIIIYFDSLFPPLVVNPEVIQSPQKFKFSKPRIKKDIMSWRVYGDVSDYPIEVQQFKWNFWRVIEEIDPLDTVENNTYSAQLIPHSGDNKFRVKTINLADEVVYSKDIEYRSPNVTKVDIKELKIKNELQFSSETEYEIYTLDGVMLLSGRDRYVDVSKLDTGEYWVNFDNQTAKIKKK